MKVEFVDQEKVTHGVQPVLQALQGTPHGVTRIDADLLAEHPGRLLTC